MTNTGSLNGAISFNPVVIIKLRLEMMQEILKFIIDTTIDIIHIICIQLFQYPKWGRGGKHGFYQH